MARAGARLKLRPNLLPALIVPDEQTWTMLGHDPAGFGAEPSFHSGTAAAVFMPNRIPEQLSASLAAHLKELPDGARSSRRDLPMPGSLDTALQESATEGAHVHPDERAAHYQHDLSSPAIAQEGSHGSAHAGGRAEHDHGDMMAIVGNPSADGLVMEPIEVRYGPLAVPFPGGLTVEATLDGDVVSASLVSGMAIPAVAGDARPAAPDPLVPDAWATAIARAADSDEGRGLGDLIAVELERAISHLAWLRAISRLFGWARLTDRTASALAELAPVHLTTTQGELPKDTKQALAAAGTAASRVLKLLSGERTLRWRLSGRGVVTPEQVESLGLNGPNARASGVERDCRCDDPAYVALGFEPLLESDCDAAARTILRAREAVQALEVARAAASAAGGADEGGGQAQFDTVEGPRGPLRAERNDTGWTLQAPGAAAARTAAGTAMVGEAWGDALGVLASFDLSPWELAP